MFSLAGSISEEFLFSFLFFMTASTRSEGETGVHEADIVGLGRAPTKPTIVYSEGVQGSGARMRFPLDIWCERCDGEGKRSQCFGMIVRASFEVIRRIHEARSRIGRHMTDGRAH